MKRIISAVTALTLLGTVAASAQGYRGNYGGSHSYNQGSYSRGYNSYDRGGYDRNYRSDYRGSYRSHNDGAALIGLGFGLMALAAIASSQHHNDHYDYRGGYYGR